MIRIIQTRAIWLTISGIVVAASLLAFFGWGLKYGIDFTGGAILEVEYPADRPDVASLQTTLAPLSLTSLIVQPVGEQGVIVRFQQTENEIRQKVVGAMNEALAGIGGESAPAVSELRYESVGPTIGAELKSKTFNAIVIVLILMVLFIAYSFRHVSKPVASWKYGVAASVALFHDVMITVGVFSVMGHYLGTEVNAPFIAALLTVLGYSVNDTIIIFDRIRENLPKSDDDFETTINKSLNQTLVRSVNTSGTVIVALLAIVLFGGASIRDFALALMIGVFVGTYSSIFIASPILVIWERWKRA